MAKDLLSDSDEELFASKTNGNDVTYTPSNSNGPCVSLDTKSTVDSENLTPSKQIYAYESASALSSAKKAAYGGAVGEASVFSLFAAPSDEQNDQQKPQMAPKLDAQTLFAFGVSRFRTIEF